MTKIFIDNNVYSDLISLLKEVKLVQGNLALNSTLNRHHDIKKFLISHQSDTLQDLEADIQSYERE